MPLPPIDICHRRSHRPARLLEQGDQGPLDLSRGTERPQTGTAKLALRLRSGPIAGFAALAILLLLPATACSRTPESSPEAVLAEPQLPHTKAGQIVGAAIDFAGGWTQWRSKKSVDYMKRTVNFNENGEPVGEVVQRHRYLLHPHFKARIEWQDEGRQTVLINNGQQTWKLVDGKVADTQAARDQAWNSTFGSHYVFCMPFKLTDPGTKLSYAGQRTLTDGTEAHRVDVAYQDGAGSAAGMHHWSYYFASGDGRLTANHLRHGPDPDQNIFSRYGDYREIEGLRLATIRYGYASNPEQEALHKTSEISYSEIHFDTVEDGGLFRVPE